MLAIGLFVVSMIIVYTFESFGGLETFGDLFELLPEPITALFRVQGGFGATATGFIAADYRHPFYLISGFAFVIAVASGAVAREVELGTALMLLASPISRWRYLSAKILVLVAGLVVIVTATWLGTFVGSTLIGMNSEIDHWILLKVQLNMLALTVAAGGIAMLISAGSSDGGQTVLWSAGIGTLMYFVDFLSVIWGPAAPLGAFTVFHYYDPVAVAQETGLPWGDLGVLMGTGLGGFAASLARFQRRDINR